MTEPEPFLSEIRIMSFNYPPKGWALCNGQLLPINQNQALFALLGTTYGGNGQTTFALPDLRGKVPIHVGNGHTLGESAGTTSVTVNTNQMPQHAHFLSASNNTGNTNINANNVLAASPSQLYDAGNLTTLHPSSVSNVGGSQPHNNVQPYLVLSFCIALQGVFPSTS
jgi:microcystin-dependent protein